MPSVTHKPTTDSQQDREEYLLSVIAERDAKIEALHNENKELKSTVAVLARDLKRFMASARNGRMIAEGQLPLFGEPITEEIAAIPEEDPQPDHLMEAPDGETPDDSIKKRNKPKRPARNLDTANLPRSKVTHELPPEQRICPITGVELVPVGTKVFEEIEYNAAQLCIVEHHQVEYGPAKDVAKERQISSVVTPLPPRPLEGCHAGPKLLAQIIVQKYLHHLPLYRQEEALVV